MGKEGIRSAYLNFDVTTEPCISFRRTPGYLVQMITVIIIIMFLLFLVPKHVCSSMARGSAKESPVWVAQLSILNVNQCRSIVALSAMALAIVVHSGRSDTTEVFPWQLISLITDTCHNECVGLAEGHRVIKTARKGEKEAFLRWKVVEVRTCFTFREIWEEKGIQPRVTEWLLINLQERIALNFRVAQQVGRIFWKKGCLKMNKIHYVAQMKGDLSWFDDIAWKWEEKRHLKATHWLICCPKKHKYTAVLPALPFPLFRTVLDCMYAIIICLYHNKNT